MKDRKTEIRDEIQKIAPMLSSIEKDNPYRVDKRYFNNLELDIYSRIKVDNPYKVETDYFDTLSNKVIEKLNDESKSKPKKRKIIFMISGIAASIILLAMFIINPKSNHTALMSSLESTEIYLEENIDDLVIEEMIPINMDINIGEGIDLISKEEMEDYIEENIDDFQIEELEELL